jgi:proteasome lid subunit RPN8/RPN11
MRTVRIHADQIGQLMAHARREHPNLACGVLAGTAEEVRLTSSCRNASEDPARRWQIDPEDLISTHRRIRQAGLQIIGYYYSDGYITQSPRPSESTRRTWAEGLSDDVLCVVISVPLDRLTCWRFLDSLAGFEEVELAISPAGGARPGVIGGVSPPVDTTSVVGIRAFLCHASEDKQQVRTLYHRLRAADVTAWFDEEDLLPGAEWESTIARAVRQSDVVLVCLSSKSTTKSGYVQRELRFALDVAEEKPEGALFIVPIRLQPCDVPERLRRWQWLNYYEEGSFERLLRALQRARQSS